MAKPLTVKAIEQLRPGATRREIPDGLQSGLYLIVQPSGVKSWALRYRFANQPKKFTIGTYPGIDIGAARKLAGKALVAVASGSDPAADKKAARASAALDDGRDRVENVIQTFVERYAKANTRESTWRETQRVLTKEVLDGGKYPWRGRRIQEITKRDVHEVLDFIVDRKAPILANRVLGKLKTFFTWCVQRGILEVSPAATVIAPSAERSGDRVLSDDEIRDVWEASGALGCPFGPFIRLLLLTGARRNEVAHLRWSEIDLDAKLWTLPKERAKNNTAHTVPLSTQALEVLRSLPRFDQCDLVFTTNGVSPISGFSRVKNRCDALLAAARGEGPRMNDWTFHDLRRSVASHMAGLGIQLPVIERVLNHTSGSFGGIVGVYQRHSYSDEKRAALAAWGRFIEQLVSGEPAGNVVALRSQATA